jgi:hypothetical protein
MDPSPLYRYDTDVNRFESILVGDALQDLISMHTHQERVAKRWKPLPVTILKPRLLVSDFPTLIEFGALPVLSTRAWNALRGLLAPGVEALPLVHPSGDYVLINVLEQLDCLDETRSTLVRNDVSGRVSCVYAYAFKQDLIGGKRIFKTPPKSGAELFVNEEVRHCVESNELKGLKFKPLPMA